jgi:hypothetical protein
MHHDTVSDLDELDERLPRTVICLHDALEGKPDRLHCGCHHDTFHRSALRVAASASPWANLRLQLD